MFWQAMAPKGKEEGIVFFHPNATNGRQLGAVSHALMASAVDDAKSIYDIDGTETSLEDLLTKEEVKGKIIKGEIRPLGIEHIYGVFPRDKK